MKLIIVHGFLGTGKTTLIKQLINDLNENKIGLIINEFNKTNIDIQELQNVFIKQEINQGSIFCSCKIDQFYETIIKMANYDLDYLLIETSGFTNPNSLENILAFIQQKIVFEQIINLTIVDTIQFPKLFAILPLLEKQLIVADTVILNKIDLINNLTSLINLITSITNVPIITTSYCALEADFLNNSFTHKKHFSKQITINSIEHRSICYQIKPTSTQIINNALSLLKNDVYRIKGYLTIDNLPTLCELASEKIILTPKKSADNQLIILYSSKNITKDKIEAILKKYQLIDIAK